MPVERSAGAVIFRETKRGREFLLLQHHKKHDTRGGSVDGHWDFPKGHIEKGEKTEDTVRREVKEETGISRLNIIPGFKETIRYFVKIGNERRLKFVVFFLACTPEKRVKISREHQGYVWLPYNEARGQLTYRNAKNVVQKAHNLLRRKRL